MGEDFLLRPPKYPTGSDQHDSSLDFCSSEFDPKVALESSNCVPPLPQVKVFPSLEEYLTGLKNSTLSDVILTGVEIPRLKVASEAKKENYRSEACRLERRKRLEDITIAGVEATVPSCLDDRFDRTVSEIMEDFSTGPFSLLLRCVKEGIKLRVWTRKAKGIRGICTGYLIAFDRHMNLAMIDVTDISMIEQPVAIDSQQSLIESQDSQQKKIRRKKERKSQKRKEKWAARNENTSTGSNSLQRPIQCPCNDIATGFDAEKHPETFDEKDSVPLDESKCSERKKKDINSSSTCEIIPTMSFNNVPNECNEETNSIKGEQKTILPKLNTELLNSLSSFVLENPDALKDVVKESQNVSHKVSKNELRRGPILIPETSLTAATDPRMQRKDTKPMPLCGVELGIVKFQLKEWDTYRASGSAEKKIDAEKEISENTSYSDPLTIPFRETLTLDCDTNHDKLPKDASQSLTGNDSTVVSTASVSIQPPSILIASILSMARDTLEIKSQNCDLKEKTKPGLEISPAVGKYLPSRLLRERSRFKQPFELVKKEQHIRQLLIRGDNVIMVSPEKSKNT